MQRDVVADAIVATIGEQGALRAGDLAQATAAALGLKAPAAQEIKAEVWRLVDEGRCLWTLDRLIDLPDAPRDVASH